MVALHELTATTQRYTIDYLRGSDVAMRFGLGVTPLGAGSGVGTIVRNSRAVLQFPSGLFSDPGGRGWRSLSWSESGYKYLIESEVQRGEDVLHVGWSLDRAGAPAAPYARTAIGSCASASSPEETVRAWVAALGRHDPDRILDCFAMDNLTVNGTSFAPGSADLPTALVDRVGSPVAMAGRSWVGVTWTFDRDPGSAWVQGQHGFLFYLVGLDDGRYRIFEGGTGAYGPPP